jgi:hypothetical protein
MKRRKPSDLSKKAQISVLGGAEVMHLSGMVYIKVSRVYIGSGGN